MYHPSLAASGRVASGTAAPTGGDAAGSELPYFGVVSSRDVGGGPGDRATHTAAAPMRQTPWECLACTYRNSCAMTACEMCGTPAPAIPAAGGVEDRGAGAMLDSTTGEAGGGDGAGAGVTGDGSRDGAGDSPPVSLAELAAGRSLPASSGTEDTGAGAGAGDATGGAGGSDGAAAATADVHVSLT